MITRAVKIILRFTIFLPFTVGMLMAWSIFWVFKSAYNDEDYVTYITDILTGR